MDQIRRNELFYRIVTGEINIRIGKQSYITTPPSIAIRNEAEERYRETIADNLYSDWFTEEQCLAVLINLGLVSRTINDDIEKAEKAIEDTKVTLYDSYMRNHRVEEVRKVLKRAKEHYNHLFNTRHMFDYLTAQHFAEIERRRFILIHTLHYKHGSLVWQNEDDVDVLLLDKISNKLILSHPTMEELRFLSRNEPWRPCWNIDKERIFNKPSFELSDEQKIVISFSQRYDNAYQHPECPSDKVFEDDDLFDGWQLTQIRKYEKEKANNDIAARTPGKIKNAGEVFILAADKDDAQKINSLNTTDAESTKQQRLRMVKNKGTVKETEFLDSKLTIQQISNEARKQRK